MGWKSNSVLVVLLLVVLAASLYFGSGYFKRQMASITGYSEICIDGIKYIQFVSGASPKYSPDGSGSLVKCN